LRLHPVLAGRYSSGLRQQSFFAVSTPFGPPNKAQDDLVLLFLDNDLYFLETTRAVLCEAEAFCTLGSEMSKRAMSDKFDGRDAIEKAAMKAALNRCRALVRQIQSRLRNKSPEHFVDKLSLADFCASVERAADVLKQKRRRSVRTRSAPAAKGSKARSRQRHR
jgi:hypothetical protein